MSLHPVTKDKASAVWPHIEHFIIAACEKGPCGDLDPCELRESCEAGRHQLWVALDDDKAPVSACVTGIRDDRGKRSAEWIAFGASSSHVWQQYMPAIEQWARDNKCRAFRSFSRPGMKRLMPDGYRVKGYIFEKAL